ncbi:MAG: ACT domain-containing protein [Akkermansiaceae bacterium]
MSNSLFLTALSPDPIGLVDDVADAVDNGRGNWQESWMAPLAGQFAGILRVGCPEGNREALELDLSALGELGPAIMVARDADSGDSEGEALFLDITGLNEPGIVKRIASALAELGANVEELQTSLESTPMAGHLLFRARGKVSFPDGLHPADLIEALEKVGPGLNVDVQ